MNEDRFEPVPFLPISDPRQLKAFADPLRNRLLHILSEREATNQQLSVIVDAPQARVLHHVRFLRNAGLIVLVEQRVRGGNVEKFYRATARSYGFRPAPADTEALAGPVSGAVFESMTQELIASMKLWPGQPTYWEHRRARISDDRLADFNRRLLALLAEYWGDISERPVADEQADLQSFAAVMFRFPGDEP